MSNFISYEDNLFFILSEVKNLKNGLKLSLNRSFFADFYTYHFTFLSKVLRSVQEKLLEHPKLVRFNECLQLLRSTESMFIELLDTFLSHSLLAMVNNSSEIILLRGSIYAMHNIVLERLSADKSLSTETDTVSNQEISDLLSF